MVVKKLDILQPLYERLKSSIGSGISRALVYGIEGRNGVSESSIALAIIHYYDQEAIKLASTYLPYGITLIGILEFDNDEEQEVYALLDQLENPVLIKVVSEDEIVATTGLDFLTPMQLRVVTREEIMENMTFTFRLKGQLLLTSPLELPDLNDCFGIAKNTIGNQAAYSFETKSLARITILPPEGQLALTGQLNNEKHGKLLNVPSTKLFDLKAELGDRKEKNPTFLLPSLNITTVKISFDQVRPGSFKNAAVVIADKTPTCKYFEHYVDLDVLVVLPMHTPFCKLYEIFNEAVCNQLETGFHANISHQLVNSISAEKPEVYHFVPKFGGHFVSVLYPQNTSEEKLKETRLELHKLFFVRETRPYFRRTAALFQPVVGLISPHVSLKGKYSETNFISGEYEYRHYMQEDFNDDGWGCAYRSLQTIVSWFRLQGYTSTKVPTHREIQECLVSLGDKPASFIGSKKWIGSTEVAFVLEALLGISCRIISLSSGGEMSSRISELQSHFKIHGTPVMIGGGVLAHTIIGSSYEPDSETDVNYLILDPHYTGKDDLKTILSKGWVGWKDNNFWSKKDFYNMCMPLLHSAI